MYKQRIKEIGRCISHVNKHVNNAFQYFSTTAPRLSLTPDKQKFKISLEKYDKHTSNVINVNKA